MGRKLRPTSYGRVHARTRPKTMSSFMSEWLSGQRIQDTLRVNGGSKYGHEYARDHGYEFRNVQCIHCGFKPYASPKPGTRPNRKCIPAREPPRRPSRGSD